MNMPATKTCCRCGETKRAKVLIEANIDKIATRRAIDAIAERIKRINRAMRLVRQSKSLGADEKRARLDELQAAKNATGRKAEAVMELFEGRR